MQEDLLTNPVEMGIMVETAVFKHVRAFYSPVGANTGYFRKNSKAGEIDVVVDYPGHRILIEVKYREHYSLGEKTSIVSESGKAVSDHVKTTALLITKRNDDYGPLAACPEVFRIPAYGFLFLLGHAEWNGKR
jgi:predicted AAA+ superfamily ATPase